MKTIITICMAGLLASTAASAQETNPQTRLIFHTTVDVSDHWFVTDWAIGNVRANSPSNFNLFPGLGFRSEEWWFEAMIWRQWNPVGENQWMLDFRYQSNPDRRISLYAEWGPFISQIGQYDFVQVNIRVYKRLSVGVETENIHRPGPDSWDIGPRLSFPVASIGEYKLSLAMTYQIHHNEPDVPRLYVVLNRRFKKRVG